MALLTVQQAAAAGFTPTYAAASASDTFPLDAKCIVHVKNSDSSSHTVTIASTRTASPGLAPANNAVAVPNASEKIIAVDPAAFADPTTNLATVTYSSITGMTIAVIRTP